MFTKALLIPIVLPAVGLDSPSRCDLKDYLCFGVPRRVRAGDGRRRGQEPPRPSRGWPDEGREGQGSSGPAWDGPRTPTVGPARKQPLREREGSARPRVSGARRGRWLPGRRSTAPSLSPPSRYPPALPGGEAGPAVSRGRFPWAIGRAERAAVSRGARPLLPGSVFLRVSQGILAGSKARGCRPLRRHRVYHAWVVRGSHTLLGPGGRPGQGQHPAGPSLPPRRRQCRIQTHQTIRSHL